MLRALLLDVGGTLWPEQVPALPGVDPCLEPLGRVLPNADLGAALPVLRDCLQQDEGSLEQDTHRALAATLRRLVYDPAQCDAVAVRRALCVPAIERMQLFHGATNLLEVARSLGLRTVVVSNVQVRGAVEYRRDFADLGIAHLIDAIVTSLEVGYRKPHLAIFKEAVCEAGCAPTECVMVGNSELKDIQPAVGFGMRAIRVAIEELPPASSAAHAVVTTLDAAAGLIRQWCDRWPVIDDASKTIHSS